MDHHCTFTNRCVGKASIKYFVLFMFYINVLTTVGIYIVFVYMNKKSFWYYQNPKVTEWYPTLSTVQHFLYFPARTDLDERNYIETFIFWLTGYWWGFTIVTSVRIFYQHLQGQSYVIYLKGKKDPNTKNKVVPRTLI